MAKASNKLAKAEVEYEHPAAKSDHCGICRHFEPPSQSCEIVRGHIRREDWCRMFAPSRVKKRYSK